MRHKGRIGSLFLVSVLAFASISVSYASVTGGFVVQGVTRTVATEFYVEAVTGMDVYKVWDVNDGVDPPEYCIVWDETSEILIISGVIGEIPDEDDVIDWAEKNNGNAMRISYASVELDELENNNYDVNLTYKNVFPGVNHTAGFIFCYKEIPVEIEIEFNHIKDDDFTDYLSYEVFNVSKQEGQWVKVDESNYRLVEITLLLPQNNDLQGLAGSFTAGKIYVSQNG
jgi:hypothetical protein